MKKLFLSVFALLLVWVSASAQQTIQVDKIPVSIDEFVALRDKIGRSPEGGAVLFVVALKMYQENPAEGIKALVTAVDAGRLSSGNGAESYKGFVISNSDWSLTKSQLAKAPYLSNSYIQGTSPADGYALKPAPYIYKAGPNKYSPDPATGTTKVFVTCTGADTPRPITLKVNDKGIWKASEWSSVLVGVRAPVVKKSDDL